MKKEIAHMGIKWMNIDYNHDELVVCDVAMLRNMS